MSVTPSNAMLGPVSIFTGTFGATEPVNAGTAPGVGWTDIGGTTDGATLTLGRTYTSMRFDQIGMDVGAQLTAQEVTVSTNMGEPTLANFRIALNLLDDAGTELEWGGEDIVNDEPNYRAVLLQGKKPGGGPRMWVVRRTLSVESIGVPFKVDGQTFFPVTWKGYYISPSVKAVRTSDTPAA